MMKRPLTGILLAGATLLLVAPLLLAACSESAQPLAFGAAPWDEGEASTYDVLGRDGTTLGTATWQWERSPDGWTQAYALALTGRQDRGEVVVGPNLAPIRSWRETGGVRYEAGYGPESVTITTTAPAGGQTTRSLKRPGDAVDNDVSLQVPRALPLAAGYATRYSDVIPTSGLSAPVRLTVTGAETVTVPAGAIPTWRVAMDIGGGKHDAWYGRSAPYPLVKYINRGSGVAFVLRSIEAEQALPISGPLASPPPAAAPAISIPLLLSSLLIQLPLMIAFPIVLGGWIRRRYRVGWGIFWAGALTFVAAQIVHLPLNYALGLLGGGRGVALWPLPLVALTAGLSAGVCEEGARWIALRFFLKRARGWRAGLQFGAGQGGSEAILFGLLAAAGLLAMLALSSLNPIALGLPAAAAEQIRAASTTYWRTAWHLPVVGGVERLFAITIQIALAEVVMLSFTRRNNAYLFAAIGLHALVDAWAVWALPTFGIAWTELGVALFAVAAFWLIRQLRDAPSGALDAAADVATPPSAPASAADLSPRSLSSEELARRADESRFD
jgi:uncharacterized membrane protein YhfC